MREFNKDGSLQVREFDASAVDIVYGGKEPTIEDLAAYLKDQDNTGREDFEKKGISIYQCPGTTLPATLAVCADEAMSEAHMESTTLKNGQFFDIKAGAPAANTQTTTHHSETTTTITRHRRTTSSRTTSSGVKYFGLEWEPIKNEWVDQDGKQAEIHIEHFKNELPGTEKHRYTKDGKSVQWNKIKNEWEDHNGKQVEIHVEYFKNDLVSFDDGEDVKWDTIKHEWTDQHGKQVDIHVERFKNELPGCECDPQDVLRCENECTKTEEEPCKEVTIVPPKCQPCDSQAGTWSKWDVSACKAGSGVRTRTFTPKLMRCKEECTKQEEAPCKPVVEPPKCKPCRGKWHEWDNSACKGQRSANTHVHA